jgi:hypothetical protein
MTNRGGDALPHVTFRPLVLVPALAMVLGCGETLAPTGGDADIVSVEVQPGSAAVVAGDSLDLRAFGRSETGDSVAVTVSWTVVGSGSVRTLDAAAARFTADLPGDVLVIARHDSTGLADTSFVLVTVDPVAVASVVVTPPADTLHPGETRQFLAAPRDAAGNFLPGRLITWNSSDASVATVGTTGLVTAVAAGSAVITATSEGVDGSADLVVQATAPPSDCSASHVRCVDDDGGGAEYGTIQSAVSAANAGDTVLVFDGSYAGFEVTRSGTAGQPIVIRARGGGAVIDRSGPTGDGARFQNVSYVRIEGFQVRDVSARCVAARGATPTSPMHGNVVRGITCTRSGTEGFYLSEFADGLVEGNDVSATGRVESNRAHGMYLANAGTDNTTVRGNTIHAITGSDAQAMHFNGDASVGGDGIISGMVVENNVIFAASTNGFNMDGVRNSVFRNNLVYDVGRHALRGYAIDGSGGPSGLHVVNNTLVAGSGNWAIKLTEDAGGHVIFNNILLGGAGSIVVGSSSLQSDYNVVTNAFSLDEEGSVISLSQWRAAGLGTHSFQATAGALFVNAGAGDLRLSATSPAIDAGAASLGGVSAPATDLVGASRPKGGGFDVGAYEER